MRKYLVVVRAGDKSLHPQWLGEKRNFDLFVSYYGDYPERYKDQYDYMEVVKGSKWQGLSEFIIKNQSLLHKYEYIWFPDDDLFCEQQVISKFFEICSLLDFKVAQPALTEYSYFSWNITLRRRGLIARKTDFVEIMAPCFKVENFDVFKSSFGENTSGHGLEWLWKKLAIENNILNFGIIDLTPVYHTRPVGSAGHGGSIGSPKSEMSDLFQKYDLIPTEPKNILEYRINNNG